VDFPTGGFLFTKKLCYNSSMEKNVNLADRDSDFKLVGSENPDAPIENVVFRPNHQLMARPRLREKDLQPQQIYFYWNYGSEPRRLEMWTEQEAAFMEKSSWAKLIRPIGCSNGQAYTKVIRDCGVKPGSVISKTKATEILNKALEAEIEAAKQHGYIRPQDQNIHFDPSFPVEQRSSFVPPK